MWTDRVQASMQQAEEHRLATLAANRKIGAVQAELTEISSKLELETTRCERLSSSLSDVQKDLQGMSAARDEKQGELDRERSVCPDLRQQLEDYASRHEKDLKSAGDEEAKLSKQVSSLGDSLLPCTSRLTASNLSVAPQSYWRIHS